METLLEGIIGMGQDPGRIVMMLIGGLLMYLGIKKEYEPTLLVPMGLGTILVNFPNSGVLQAGGEAGPFQVLFDAGISTELFPLLLFIGIGAMIDFGPLLQNPFLLLFGAAAQFGIFFTVIVAVLLGFDNYRCCRWSNFNLCCQHLKFQIYGGNYGCGLLLHGISTNHSTSGD